MAKKKKDNNKPELLDIAHLIIDFGLLIVAILALIFR